MQKKKSALGDIKNYAPNTPLVNQSAKKAQKESVNTDQIDLLKNIGLMNNENAFFETCSSLPIDYYQKWMDSETLTDEEINEIISDQCCPRSIHDDDGDLPPPPPSPFEELQSTVFSLLSVFSKLNHSYFEGIEDSFEMPSLEFDVNAFFRNERDSNDDRPSLNHSVFDSTIGELESSMSDIQLDMHF